MRSYSIVDKLGSLKKTKKHENSGPSFQPIKGRKEQVASLGNHLQGHQLVDSLWCAQIHNFRPIRNTHQEERLDSEEVAGLGY